MKELIFCILCFLFFLSSVGCSVAPQKATPIVTENSVGEIVDEGEGTPVLIWGTEVNPEEYGCYNPTSTETVDIFETDKGYVFITSFWCQQSI